MNDLRRANKRQQGFTLIEVMIVVAILGIVSAIAIPSYTEYVRKGKRADAKVELLKIAQLQESFFVQNLTYAKTLDIKTNGSGLGLGATGATIYSEQEEYKITIAALDSGDASCTGLIADACASFTLTAEPQGGQAKDKCSKFTLSNTGAKGLVAMTGNPAVTSALIKKCWR